jgi:hypothetical protein
MMSGAETGTDDKVVTAAEIVRRRCRGRVADEEEEKAVGCSTTRRIHAPPANQQPTQRSNESTTTTTTTTIDLDEEIARLQAELDREEESDGSDEDYDDNDDDDADGSGSFGGDNSGGGNVGADQGGIVLCLSAAKDERIEPLPTHCLPAPPRPNSASHKRKKMREMLGADDVGSRLEEEEEGNEPIEETNDGRSSGKRQRRHEEADEQSRGGLLSNKRYGLAGLESAVREVLDSYVPRSSERLPFYCRACAVQLASLQEFRDHQQTNSHRTAVDVERIASFCRLCRKQLTSPAQLREHLQSRPHKERLERTKQNHRHRLPAPALSPQSCHLPPQPEHKQVSSQR